MALTSLITASVLRESFCQSYSLQHRFALVHRFLKFRFRLGVVHPAAAVLHAGFAVLEQRRADVDAGVQIAVEAERASRNRHTGRVSCLRVRR